MSGLFVAIGDSFTEGVGDWDPRLPNGVRGWADRVAKQLSKDDPAWRYANLAVRSRRLGRIVQEQVEPALAMEPSVITFYAGGNDIMEVRQDMGRLLDNYTAAVRRLASSGARVLLFTGFDVPVHPILEPMKRRNWIFNQRVRELAAEHAGDGVELVDYWTWDAYQDRRLWDTDKLHMNRAGHRYMAIQVLNLLGVRHQLVFEPFGPRERPGLRDAVVRDAEWMRQWVLPMFGRKLRGITLGDALQPRWPDPVRPADGLKRLHRKRQRLTMNAS
ncbi:SGNH/GDSL hydrolase family protein [Zafaria sp. Z1313]|uniref:SGNH/GDSL hydrolase family protein n=1 Tax=Zafaria sp. Z1313 TaxID=3423202 RepID=UPI003D30217F